MVGPRRPRRGRPAGWLFALLVMCFAVLPHLTFAAAMTGTPLPAHALSTEPATSGMEQAEAAAPCHPSSPVEHPAPHKPACCVVACGLIAEAPVTPVFLKPLSWSRVPPPLVLLARGRSTEPAEPPPRKQSQA